jgi:hypothetical protein
VERGKTYVRGKGGEVIQPTLFDKPEDLKVSDQIKKLVELRNEKQNQIISLQHERTQLENEKWEIQQEINKLQNSNIGAKIPS